MDARACSNEIALCISKVSSPRRSGARRSLFDPEQLFQSRSAAEPSAGILKTLQSSANVIGGSAWRTTLSTIERFVTKNSLRESPQLRRPRNHNYIVRRQQAGLVTGVPTIRRIIGKREIDVYRNGLIFERDHVVGVKGTR
jgi:hypothetical protein